MYMGWRTYLRVPNVQNGAINRTMGAERVASMGPWLFIIIIGVDSGKQ